MVKMTFIKKVVAFAVIFYNLLLPMPTLAAAGPDSMPVAMPVTLGDPRTIR